MTSDWGLVRGAIALILALASSTQLVHADPFPTRDQNPLLIGFALPRAMPAAPADQPWAFGVDLSWGSTALIQGDTDEALIVDAETRAARLTLRRALSERFQLQASIPYHHVGAGSLDSFIDDWHDAFGLPEGARPLLGEDRLRIAYERDGRVVFDEWNGYDGLGDVGVDLGWRLHEDESLSLTAWLSVELPTADNEFVGNGALDASVIAAVERRLSERWSVYGQAGVTRLGEGDLLRAQQRSAVWSGLAGVNVRALPFLDLRLQLDAHTAIFDDSELDYLGEAAMLTVGGALHFQSGWRLELAVSEDIAVESAPDVVFVLAIAKKGPGTSD